MLHPTSALILLLLGRICLVFGAIVPARSCEALEILDYGLELTQNVHFNSSLYPVGSLSISGVQTTNAYPVCRVMGTIAYGARHNNTLIFEVWLPQSAGYNGRYLSVGNGGFAGTIDYSSMMSNLNSGFAVGGCDSGHKTSQNGPTMPGGYVDFMNNRDETLAWIHNSIAMFTAPAKTLATAYYRQAPKKMYYAGCSTGGAQGFALAQFHPEIFDGIIAGSPGNHYSHLILSFLWNGLNSNSTDSFLSQDALDFLKDAVVNKCDIIDGVQDGLIEDPTKCDFDVSSLICADGQAPTVNNATICLTSAQIENVKKFYAGPMNENTGASVYPGFALGSEGDWMPQETSLWIQYGVPILQNLVFKNLSYDYTTFNWGSDVAAVDITASPLIDEISPDLHAFKNQGGKMIVTQGWADPYNAPTWPIKQHDEMHDIFGSELDTFYTLFMVPGGGHCTGASSYPQMPGTWHSLDALVPWVEQGKAPRQILATDPADGSNTTRKLCPYPQNAVYTSGSIDNWESYVCK